MTNLEFYIERAAQCRNEAAASKLENVRDRCLRSATAWETMADQLRISEAYRVTEAARKAESLRQPDEFFRG